LPGGVGGCVHNGAEAEYVVAHVVCLGG
jgi:hypothetical protein